MTSEEVKERLQGSKDAIRRARTTHTVLVTASLMILAVEYNTQFSWLRGLVFQQLPDSPDPMRKVALEAMVRAWTESKFVSVPLLGTRFSADDAGILGSAALLVLCLWHYFAVRRENHAIALLLADTVDDPPAVRRQIFFGLSDTMVFTPIGESDVPLDDLADASRYARLRVARRPSRPWLRSLAVGLTWAPWWAILATLGTDWWSLTVASPVRFSDDPLYEVLLAHPGRPLFTFVVMTVLSVTVLTVVWRICRASRAFEEATVSVLRQYRERLPSDRSRGVG